MLLKNKSSLIFIFINLLYFTYCQLEQENGDKSIEAPDVNDLIVYLNSLRYFVSFCSFDQNLNYFGLFLAKANLKHALRYNDEMLGENVSEFIKDLVKDIEGILSQRNKLPKRSRIEQSVFLLISNDSNWIEGMRRFKYSGMHKSLDKKRQPRDWQTYKNIVSNLEAGVPTPEESDKCIISIMNSPEINTRNGVQCYDIQPHCYHSIQNGTFYGYSLTHRILLLLIANLGRGCSVFSRQEDRLLMHQLCVSALREAQYLAPHADEGLDLMMEQVSLCSLAGVAEFMRRDWYSHFLNIQPSGCLSNIPWTTLDDRNEVNTKEIDKHDTHLYSVAVASIAAGVRFIIESY